MLLGLSLVGWCSFCGIQVNCDSSKVDATLNNMRTVETGLKLFAMKKGRYPMTQDGLAVLVQARILDRTPKDAWGNEFTFISDGKAYAIVSFGADGGPGGKEAEADLVAVGQTLQ